MTKPALPKRILNSHKSHSRLIRGSFNILSLEDNGIAGTLWLAIEKHTQNSSAFIYDIEVKKNYRRKGLATNALIEIEAFVKTLDIKTLGLHVFRQNTSAQKLYSSLGYDVVSMNMAKSLD